MASSRVESTSADSRSLRVGDLNPGHLAGSGGSAHVGKSARLLPELFKGIDPTERLKVLEIGRAQPETIEFFSRYKCRLQFADIYSSAELLEEQAKLSEAELAVGFRKALDIPREAKFDVCLLWDILLYLTGPAIRALCGVLEPHIHAGTRAHGIGVHSTLTRCERAEYAITASSEFRLKQGRLPELEYRPHPQAELSEMLTVFKIERAMLMGDGTVEMLMRSKPYWNMS
jgi:hypothetical protein